MFIERLTKDDIQAFIGNNYIVVEDIHISPYVEPEIYMNIIWKYNEHSRPYVFLDFESRGLSYPDKWIKYLGDKFGDEYKEAYKEHCMDVFN